MANKDYWKRRAEERKNRVSRTADEAAQEAKEAYERAKHRISKEVAYWIQQFADAEGITYEEARKLLESGELDEFRMTLEDYIAHGEQLGVDDSWLDAMIKASAIHHIDRLNALKLIIRAELEETKVKLQDAEWMHNLADYSFQQTLFTIETDQEVAIQFRLPDLETMHRDIEEAWAPDGMDFVTREGVNNDKLAAEVDRLITQACITGESYDDLAKQLEAQFDLKAYEAERIIRTESTRVASLSEAAAYKATGIEEYEILVTLDERTCSTCGPMDGHVEKVENMEPGVTAPPFHPNCRCTTIGHYEDDLIDETRIARDEDGNPIHVDGDMTWEEWKGMYAEREKGLSSKGVGSKDVPDHEPPVFLEKIDPRDRNAILSVLEKYESVIADSDIENAIVVCMNGDVYRCFGDKNGVWPDADLGDKLKGASVSHNHPIGSNNEYSFSDADINLFVEHKLSILRGIDERYVYQMDGTDSHVDQLMPLKDITEYDARSETVKGVMIEAGIGYRRWNRG